MKYQSPHIFFLSLICSLIFVSLSSNIVAQEWLVPWNEINNTDVYQGQDVSIQLPGINATSLTNEEFIFFPVGSEEDLFPEGLSYNEDTNTLEGTLPKDIEAPATFTFSYTSTYTADGVFKTKSEILYLNIQINSFPVFGQVDDIYVTENEWTFSTTLPEATEGNGSLFYTLTSANGNALPAEFSFNYTTRLFSGTTDEVGTYLLAYSAVDQDSDLTTINISVITEQDVQPEFLISASNYSSPVDDTFTTTALVSASSGNGKLDYTLVEKDTNTLPGGLSFDNQTLILSGSHPTVESFTLVLTATDLDGDSDSTEFTFEFVAEDLMPSFGSDQIADQTEVIAHTFNQGPLPAATSGDGTLIYGLLVSNGSNLPSSLSFDSATRILSGNIDTNITLNYSVTDQDNDIASLLYSIIVEADSQPSLPETITLESSLQNTAFSVLLPSATGGNEDLAYSLTTFNQLTLPNSFSFDPVTRVLSGNAATAKTYYFDYNVTDYDGDTANKKLSLVIAKDLDPSFALANLSIGAITGQAFEKVLPLGLSGNSPLNYSIVSTGSNSLAADFSFTASTRTLSGTVSAASNLSFEYTVTDSDNDTAMMTIYLEVTVDSSPSLASITNPDTLYAGDELSLQLPLSPEGNQPILYSVTQKDNTPLPAWLNFNSSSLILSGTPANADIAVLELVYTALDQDDETASQSFNVSVVEDIALAWIVEPEFTTDLGTYTSGYEISPIQLGTAIGNPPLTYSLSGSFPGLTLNSSTAILTGIPTHKLGALNNEVKNYFVTFIVTDDNGDQLQAFYFMDQEVDLVPSFGELPALYATNSSTFTHTLEPASSGNGVLSYNVTYQGSTDLPGNLVFDNSTLQLTGLVNTIGNYTFEYTAWDEQNNATNSSFVLAVSLRLPGDIDPIFVNASVENQTVIAGEAITDIILPLASKGNDPLVYSVAIQGDSVLPAGLSFDNITNTLSGSPTQAGIYELKYKVLDAESDEANLNFSITVLENLFPIFAVTDQSFSYELNSTQLELLANATGGNGNLSYSLADLDDLPAGITYSELNNSLSGKWGVDANYSLTLTASDENDDTVSISINIEVFEVLDLKLASVDDISVVTDKAIDSQVLPKATDSRGTVSYSLTIKDQASLPAGLSFDTSSRVLSGTPTVAANYTLVYSAQDIDENQSSEFNLEVNTNLVPLFAETSQSYLFEASSQAAVFLPSATGGNEALSYSLSDVSALPAGISYSAINNTLNGQWGLPANYSLTLTVSDNDDDTASMTIDIEVFQPLYLTLASYGNISVIVGQPLAEQTLPAATDNIGQVNYTLTIQDQASLPAGLSFDASSRVLSGTPSLAANYTLVYSAQDDDETQSIEFSLTVYPNLTPSFAQASQSYLFTASSAAAVSLPSAIGGDGNLTYSLADLSVLPAGISYSAANNSLNGQWGLPANYSLTLTAGDEQNDQATISISIEVFEPTSLFLASYTNISAIAGQPLAEQTLPSAEGNSSEVSYSLTIKDQLTLPSGLIFNASSLVLSGTPIAQANYTLVYSAQDDDETQSIEFGLTVNANLVPSFAQSSQSYSIAENSDMGVSLPSATGGDGILSYSLADLDDLPAGIIYSSVNNSLFGQWGLAANFSLVLSVNDEHNDTASMNINIEVYEELSLSLASYQSISAVSGKALGGQSLPSATGNSSEVSYNLSVKDASELPAGLSFNASSLTLSGTPTLEGNYILVYSAQDDDETQSIEFNLSVTANSVPVFTQSSASYLYEIGSNIAVSLPTASGGNTPISYTLLNASLLSDSVVFSSEERAINGDSNEQDNVTLSWQVEDSDGDIATFNLTLKFETASTPKLVGLTNQTVYSSESTLVANLSSLLTGGNGDINYNFSVDNSAGLIEGLTFNSLQQLHAQGLDNGNYSIEITLTDSDENQEANDKTTANFVLSVVENLSWDAAIANLSLNVFSTETFGLSQASGGQQPNSYSLTLLNGSVLPSWLIFNDETLELTASPQLVETTSLLYTVSDANGQELSANFTVSTLGLATLGTITEVEGISAAINASSSIQFPEGNGGLPPYSYAIILGDQELELPSWLSFDNTTRILSINSPQSIEAINLEYRVTDSLGSVSSQPFSFNVVEKLVDIALTSALIALEADLGESIEETLPGVTDTINSYTFTVTGLPQGLTFNPVTRVISGAAERIGTYTAVYTVVETLSLTTKSFNFDVTIGFNEDLASDALYRTAAALSQYTVSTIVDRINWTSKERSPYSEDDQGSSIDLNLEDGLRISAWTRQGSIATARSKAEGLGEWSGDTSVSQIGFDVSYPTWFAGAIVESSDSSLDFDKDASSGTIDTAVDYTTMFAGIKRKDLSVWLSTSSGSDGSYQWAETVGSELTTLTSTVDYASTAVGLNYRWKNLNAGLTAITSAKLSLKGDLDTSADASSSRLYLNWSSLRNKHSGWQQKLSLTYRDDASKGTSDISEGSSGLEVAASANFKKNNLLFDVGLRTLATESSGLYSETAYWLTLGWQPSQNEGLGWSLKQQVGNVNSEQGSLLSAQSIESFNEAQNVNDGMTKSIAQVSYNWSHNQFNWKVYTASEQQSPHFEISPFNTLGMKWSSAQAWEANLQHSWNSDSSIKLQVKIPIR